MRRRGAAVEGVDERAPGGRTSDAEAAFYRRFFDIAPVALFRTDSLGTIADANAAACELLDLDGRFVVGKPLAMFIDPPSRRSFRGWLLTVRGSAASSAFRLRRRSGLAFDVSARVEPWHDELLWSVVDVSEARRTESELWALNRDLELRVAIQTAEVDALLEQIPVGVAVVDEEARLVRVNHRARELLSADPGATPADWRVPIEDALHAGESTQRRARVLAPDGKELLVDARIVPVRAGMSISGAVVTFDDITRRDRRERADREFISNAAHQMRTPITAIASAVETLQSGAKDDPEAMERFVRHIEAAAARLAALTQSLLTLSRVERGDIDAPTAVVRIRPLLELLAANAETDRVAAACSDRVAAVTHEGLLQEALASLLDNALRHTAGPVSLTARVDDGETIVDVLDRGAGIPSEQRAWVFQRFTSGGGGAGLGLAIAAAAVTAAGGSLQLEDADGGGTLARITLRAARMLP